MAPYSLRRFVPPLLCRQSLLRRRRRIAIFRPASRPLTPPPRSNRQSRAQIVFEFLHRQHGFVRLLRRLLCSPGRLLLGLLPCAPQSSAPGHGPSLSCRLLHFFALLPSLHFLSLSHSCFYCCPASLPEPALSSNISAPTSCPIAHPPRLSLAASLALPYLANGRPPLPRSRTLVQRVFELSSPRTKSSTVAWKICSLLPLSHLTPLSAAALSLPPVRPTGPSQKRRALAPGFRASSPSLQPPDASNNCNGSNHCQQAPLVLSPTTSFRHLIRPPGFVQLLSLAPPLIQSRRTSLATQQRGLAITTLSFVFPRLFLVSHGVSVGRSSCSPFAVPFASSLYIPFLLFVFYLSALDWPSPLCLDNRSLSLLSLLSLSFLSLFFSRFSFFWPAALPSGTAFQATSASSHHFS